MKQLLIFALLQCLVFSGASQSNTHEQISNEKKAKSRNYTKKNFFWYTPNKVEQINGVAVGAWSENLKNDEIGQPDSLKINGINLEINPVALFILIRGVWTHSYPDSICYYNECVKNKQETKINGANFSVLGTIGGIEINGVNIGGLNTVVNNINGVTICGLNNFAYELNGVSVAIFHNKAAIAKGVQISLFNEATELRGFQFGLWNVNGKRSLPIINGQFRSKKRAKEL